MEKHIEGSSREEGIHTLLDVLSLNLGERLHLDFSREERVGNVGYGKGDRPKYPVYAVSAISYEWESMVENTYLFRNDSEGKLECELVSTFKGTQEEWSEAGRAKDYETYEMFYSLEESLQKRKELDKSLGGGRGPGGGIRKGGSRMVNGSKKNLGDKRVG